MGDKVLRVEHMRCVFDGKALVPLILGRYHFTRCFNAYLGTYLGYPLSFGFFNYSQPWGLTRKITKLSTCAINIRLRISIVYQY